MARPKFHAAKKCIFCGVSEVTKEHFYSDWMKGQLPLEGGYRSVGMHNHPVAGINVFRDASRPDRITSLKFRVVCGACNNGWMSEAEERAKGSLTALIAGEPISLDEADQESLARWITMKCIVLEHANRGEAVTPESDRFDFAKSGKIPDYFRLYLISHRSSQLVGALRRTMAGCLPGTTNFEPPLGQLKKNIQRIEIFLGKTFVYVNAARIDGFDLEDRIHIPLIHEKLRIWPPQSVVFELPTADLASPQTLVKLSETWERFFNHPKVLWGGDLPEGPD